MGGDFEKLLRLAKDRGYTPGASSLAQAWAALDLVDKKEAKLLERLILRALRSSPGLGALAIDWAKCQHPERYLRVWGRAAQEGERSEAFRAALPAALQDPRLPFRRQAVIWVGKFQAGDLFDQYVAGMSSQADPALRDAIMECAALCVARSKLAGQILDELSEAGVAPPDRMEEIGNKGARKAPSKRAFAAISEQKEQQQRRQARVQLIAKREHFRAKRPLDPQRTQGEAIEAAMKEAMALPELGLELRCRDGLQPWLRQELASLPLRRIEDLPGGLRLQLARPYPMKGLADLRCALDWSWTWPARDVQEFLAHPPLRAQIEGLFASRPIPFRVQLDGDSSSSSRGRAALWSMAQEAAQSWDALINEPVMAALVLVVRERVTRRGELRHQFCLRLRRGADPRFAYRVQDLPAASHPTIAAGLALAARIQPSEIVWDPFAGSGLELIESCLSETSARGIGSDIDKEAIAAAAQNAQAAGLDLELHHQDARRVALPKIHKVVSNPPHGRRVSRAEDLEKLHAEVLHHALDHLVPGGEIHWLSPRPDAMKAIALQRRCTVLDGPRVDLSGVYAQYQCIVQRR